MKKLLLWVIGFIVVVFLISLFIPTTATPPKDTRIILEHTHKTYIAPPCFEQSDPTNNIAESDLETAVEEEGYPAHDACTKEELQAEEDTLGLALLKKIGLMDTKWDAW